MTQPAAAQITPISPSLDAARRALAAVLDATHVDHRTRLAAAEALAVLSEVRPPYPPATGSGAGTPEVLLADALARLETAIGEAGSIDELTRIATAALILRRRGGDPS
jgi:hypothetical protein